MSSPLLPLHLTPWCHPSFPPTPRHSTATPHCLQLPHHKYCCSEHPHTCPLIHLLETLCLWGQIYAQEWNCWVTGYNPVWTGTVRFLCRIATTPFSSTRQFLYSYHSSTLGNTQLSLFIQSNRNKVTPHYSFNWQLFIFLLAFSISSSV